MKNKNGVLGSVVKQERIAARMTREEFSEKIGKSPRYIAAMENEGQTPGYETLRTIITTLGIDPNVIFYPDGPAQTEEVERVIRMVRLCDERQLAVVAAMVEALLEMKK